MKVATKERTQWEDEEAERLVRPAPKQKPPRHDRRRERMNVDPDIDEDPDLAKIAARVVAQVQDRVPARSKETGDIVFVSPDTLRERPNEYEEVKDEGPSLDLADERGAPQDPSSGGSEAKHPSGPGDSSESTGEEEKSKPSSDPSESEAAPAPKPKAPKKSVAQKLGLPVPAQREVTEAERAQTSLLLADSLPPKVAAQLIAERMHPDDAKKLVASYKAAQSRPVGDPVEYASKLVGVFNLNPNTIKPPEVWGPDKIAFKDLTAEEQAKAYRQHQLDVLAVSMAAEQQLQKKLTFEGSFPSGVAKVMTQVLLKGQSEVNPKMLQAAFDFTSKHAKTSVPEGRAKKILAALEGNPGVQQLARAALAAADYNQAKTLYLGSTSENEKPQDIARQILGARDFFKVKSRVYGGPHLGGETFEAKTLRQLKALDADKYQEVRSTLDRHAAADYDKELKAYEKAMKAHEKAVKAWQATCVSDRCPDPPEAPKPPVEPPGYVNTKTPEELKQEGRSLWERLTQSNRDKTASSVAARHLISSYLDRRAMAHPPKKALYHGIDPQLNAPEDHHYPEWASKPARDFGESDWTAILNEAQRWLQSPDLTHGTEGLTSQRLALMALDYAISTLRYRLDAPTYAMLLARLNGEDPNPAVPLAVRYALDRARLEKLVFSKFPPDSKRKSGQSLVVMLTGNTAKELRRKNYETVVLSQLSLDELQTLARIFGLRTAGSTFARAKVTLADNNGASSMLRLSKEQDITASSILGRLDKLAASIQANHAKWGLSFRQAKELVHHLDKTADETETLFYGEASLQRRQAEVALGNEDFRRDVVKAGHITPGKLAKAAAVLQRDSDEPYMDTFKNPMSPIETDADEPYMAAYGDDQSAAVHDGEDSEGRDLYPGA